MARTTIGWHHDFADAQQRLHDWVAACGTRLDNDESTRQTWLGEDPTTAAPICVAWSRGRAANAAAQLAAKRRNDAHAESIGVPQPASRPGECYLQHLQARSIAVGSQAGALAGLDRSIHPLNAASPGIVYTPMTADLTNDAASAEQIAAMVLMPLNGFFRTTESEDSRNVGWLNQVRFRFV